MKVAYHLERKRLDHLKLSKGKTMISLSACGHQIVVDISLPDGVVYHEWLSFDDFVTFCEMGIENFCARMDAIREASRRNGEYYARNSTNKRKVKSKAKGSAR